MLRRMLRILAAGAVIGLLLAGCSDGDEAGTAADDPAPSSVTGVGVGRSGDDVADAPAEPEDAPAEVEDAPAEAGEAPDAPVSDEVPEEGREDGAATDGAAGEAQEGEGSALPPTQPPPGDRVIKEGTITVEVEAFDAAFRAVVDAATRLGGTVVASTSSTDDHGTAGSVTVRVPVDEYEQLLTGLDGVGEIIERDITARDVTTEYTDLESRLRHLRAQERFYLELMEDADSVADAVTVRQQLDGLQADIEQIQGRLQLLDERTTYSTLTVELVEPGAPLLAGGSGARPTLAEYWERARDAFTTVVGVMLVSALFLAPLALPAALAFLAWRNLRNRPAPAVADGE